MQVRLDGQEVEMEPAEIMAEAQRRGVTMHALLCRNPRACVICNPQFCLRDIIDEMHESIDDAQADTPILEWAERLAEIADQVRKMELRLAGKLG